MTEIYHQSNLDQAAEALRQGDLVAFPTETVYGLGAIANNAQAVDRVFEVKGRPNDNPLIVHISNLQQLEGLVQEISPLAKCLMDHFWPGPLTVILPLVPGSLPDNVTSHKSNVAVRMPDNELTLELIDRVGFPLVGPSANISGKPSPTSLRHVLDDFEDRIKGVVDNQQELTQVGVESTVIYPHDDRVDILRPGVITPKAIEQVCQKPVSILSAEDQLKNPNVASPGVKYRHYSPRQPVVFVESAETLEDWINILEQDPRRKGLIADDDHIARLVKFVSLDLVYSLGSAGDITMATRKLYDALRTMDASQCEVIYLQALPEGETSQAFRNRALKACSFVV